MIPRVLTIAGSDGSGGAGIQADLKTFAVFEVYGMSAITALTAQNTQGVSGIHAVPPDFVRQQIAAVVSDIGVDAAKTGMLANGDVLEIVAEAMRQYRIAPLVVDPVLIAHSGDALFQGDAPALFRRHLLPLATVVTPNVPEAEALTGMSIRSVSDMRRAARVLIGLGARASLVKGGHLAHAEAVDVFDDGCEVVELAAPRLAARHTHGTGCQLSAALAACLGQGLSLRAAVERSKEFITTAIAAGLAIGHGIGPANPLAWPRRGFRLDER